MSTTMFGKLGIVTAAGLLLTHGCRFSEVNTKHCAYNEGDAYCAAQHPDGSRPYCESGEEPCVSPDTLYGCVAERPADACYSPCGGRSTIDENGECVMVEDSSTGPSSGTDTEESGSGESSTTGPMPCMGNEDCLDAAAPFCEPVSGECVGCEGTDDPDGACAGLDPGLPLCVGGACVQCTGERPEACEGTTPVCDEATSTCVACTEHGECGEAACNLFTGACLPGDAVVHVGGATPDFATIDAAVSSFDAMTEGTIVVHAGAYNDQVVTVDGGRVLAFLAAEDAAAPPRWTQSSGGAPQLTVTDATVLMEGVQVSGNADDLGVRIDGGRAWLDRSRVVGNTGGGIVAESGAELVLRNCFVGDGTNGDNALTVDGTMSMTSAVVVYTTLGSGVDNFNDVFPVYCDGAVDVAVRNSLLVSFDNPVELSCSMATVTNTASEALIPGMGNIALGDVGPDWFVDVDTGNFVLNNPPGVLATAARWATGDPPTDIDGDPRPAVDEAPDFAGADVP